MVEQLMEGEGDASSGNKLFQQENISPAMLNSAPGQ